MLGMLYPSHIATDLEFIDQCKGVTYSSHWPIGLPEEKAVGTRLLGQSQSVTTAETLRRFSPGKPTIGEILISIGCISYGVLHLSYSFSFTITQVEPIHHAICVLDTVNGSFILQILAAAIVMPVFAF